MATKTTTKAETKADDQAKPAEEVKTYEVTAARHLGRSITGGARIAAGQTGTIAVVPSRHARLKKAGYFK